MLHHCEECGGQLIGGKCEFCGGAEQQDSENVADIKTQLMAINISANRIANSLGEMVTILRQNKGRSANE